MSRTRIKFCGIVDARDARDAVALGVDAIGLVFYPRSPRALDPAHAAGIRRALPSYVAAVGLFVDARPDEVRRVAGAVGLDTLQFHGNESPDECEASTPAGVRWWRAVRMRAEVDLLESFVCFERAEALLLDSFSPAYGGSGTAFDWSLIPAQRPLPIVLSGGLSPDNVADAIEQVQPNGVDVSSGIQADAADGTPGGEPRRKSLQRMERFMAEVLRADAARQSR
ncbi:MAG: phosphoribosylanthranilate isomerase [Burkholderiales bacterium]|nr:MAG: phosphoribosylanthranilate isomerase [Burkholderiales bacterium]